MSSPQNTSNLWDSSFFFLGTVRATFPPLRIWIPEVLPPAQNEPRWTFFVVSRATKLYVCSSGQASEGAIWVRPILLKSAWKVILTGALKHQWNVRLNSKRGWKSIGMTTCLQGFVLHSKGEWSRGHCDKMVENSVFLSVLSNQFNLHFNQLQECLCFYWKQHFLDSCWSHAVLQLHVSAVPRHRTIYIILQKP